MHALGIQTGQGRAYLHISGPEVGIFYILGAFGIYICKLNDGVLGLFKKRPRILPQQAQGKDSCPSSSLGQSIVFLTPGLYSTAICPTSHTKQGIAWRPASRTSEHAPPPPTWQDPHSPRCCYPSQTPGPEVGPVIV